MSEDRILRLENALATLAEISAQHNGRLAAIERSNQRLEQGFQKRSGWLGNIRVSALLAPLHGDPRFEVLAEKIVPAREFAKAATTSK